MWVRGCTSATCRWKLGEDGKALSLGRLCLTVKPRNRQSGGGHWGQCALWQGSPIIRWQKVSTNGLQLDVRLCQWCPVRAQTLAGTAGYKEWLCHKLGGSSLLFASALAGSWFCLPLLAYWLSFLLSGHLLTTQLVSCPTTSSPSSAPATPFLPPCIAVGCPTCFIPAYLTSAWATCFPSCFTDPACHGNPSPGLILPKHPLTVCPATHPHKSCTHPLCCLDIDGNPQPPGGNVHFSSVFPFFPTSPILFPFPSSFFCLCCSSLVGQRLFHNQ